MTNGSAKAKCMKKARMKCMKVNSKTIRGTEMALSTIDLERLPSITSERTTLKEIALTCQAYPEMKLKRCLIMQRRYNSYISR